MKIETERLILRDFCLKDLYDLHEIFGDDETMKNCEPAYDIEKTSKFLKEFCIDRKGAYAVVEKESSKVIGYVLFKPYGELDVYEIGWIFNRKYWCKGYAYESCSNLIRYAFAELNVSKIFAEAMVDMYLYGLIKEDLNN